MKVARKLKKYLADVIIFRKYGGGQDPEKEIKHRYWINREKLFTQLLYIDYICNDITIITTNRSTGQPVPPIHPISVWKKKLVNWIEIIGQLIATHTHKDTLDFVCQSAWPKSALKHALVAIYFAHSTRPRLSPLWPSLGVLSFRAPRLHPKLPAISAAHYRRLMPRPGSAIISLANKFCWNWSY